MYVYVAYVVQYLSHVVVTNCVAYFNSVLSVVCAHLGIES